MDYLYIGIILIVIGIIIYLSILLSTSNNTDNSEAQKSTTDSTINSAGGGAAISNISPSRANMELCQYSIKSSYNSAYDGSKMTTDQLTNVINHSCRFLDLEIYSIDGVPSVGYSVDPTLNNLNSSNTILLTDAFTTILSNCFSSLSCPNPGDPVFIQLRIKSTDTNAIYKSVASNINSVFANTGKLYVDKNKNPIPVNAKTKLSDMNGFIVFVIDKSINPDYGNYTTCYGVQNCYDLTKYINMESGGSTLRISTFGSILTQATTPPVIMDDYTTTNASNLNLAVPDPILNVKNPLVFDFMLKYGIQNIAYQFWKKDQNLVIYESIYSEYKTSFVPFAYALQYVKELQHNMNSGLPIPGVNS